MLSVALGLCLVAPLSGMPESDYLAEARRGEVTPVDELLSDLLAAGPGSTAGLIAELQTALETSQPSGVNQLLEQVLLLPEAVLADRAGVPVGAMEAQRWARGTGIGLDVLSALGGTTEILLLRNLLDAPDEISPEVLALQQGPVEQTLRNVLQRESAAFSAIGALYRDIPAWSATSLLRAVAGTRSLDGLHALPNLLGKRRELDAYVLTQIASIARFARAPLSESELDRIRAYLDARIPAQRRHAAQALGFLDDTSSIGALIELLQDPDKSVGQASYSALRLITAMTIDPGHAIWINWHTRESLWWERDAEPHLRMVQSGRTGGLVVALRELGARRLFRREIAPHLVPLLRSRRDETIRVALSALTSLRANDTETLEAMEALLEHRNEKIRTQVSASLRLITRRHFAPKAPHAAPR